MMVFGRKLQLSDNLSSFCAGVSRKVPNVLTTIILYWNAEVQRRKTAQFFESLQNEEKACDIYAIYANWHIIETFSSRWNHYRLEKKIKQLSINQKKIKTWRLRSSIFVKAYYVLSFICREQQGVNLILTRAFITFEQGGKFKIESSSFNFACKYDAYSNTLSSNNCAFLVYAFSNFFGNGMLRTFFLSGSISITSISYALETRQDISAYSAF